MRRRSMRLFALALGCCGLALAGMALPAAAQTPPAPTPTPTLPDVVGVGPQVNWLTELWNRFGWWLIPLLVLIALVWIGWKLIEGVGEGIKERVKKAVEKPLDTLAEREKKQAATQKQQLAHDAGISTYLNWVQNTYADLQTLPLERATRQVRLATEKVYVALRVVERERIEGYRKLMRGDGADAGDFQLRRDAFEQLQQSEQVFELLGEPRHDPAQPAESRPARTRHLLLIGDAGSGKTTTLQYGALMLARAYAQNSVILAQRMLKLDLDQPLLPIYVRLTLFSSTLPDGKAGLSPAEQTRYQHSPTQRFFDWLDALIAEQLRLDTPDFPAHLLSQRIRRGGCLLLLDGLDETGDERRRGQVMELIENLCDLQGTHAPNRFLVAGRPFTDAFLPGFMRRDLTPLNEDEAQLLLERWFGAVGDVDRQLVGAPEIQTRRLWAVINSNDRLFEMATNPLLLTSMALLQVNSVELPNDRAELYRRFVDLLLEKWRQKQKASGNQLFAGDEARLVNEQRRLQRLALEMQERELREVSLPLAQELLRPHAQPGMDDDEADRRVATLLELLVTESGLLQERAGKYTFAHYTLQEYLAARAVDLLLDEQDQPCGVAFLFERRQRQRWRETILLAIGHWVGRADKPRQAQRLIEQLLASADTTTDDLFLAAEALVDALNVDDLRELRSRTTERLQTLAFHNPPLEPDPRRRNRAAELLDRLGADEERPGLRLDQADYWAARIEAGPFRMGEGKNEFEFTITRPYALARFPVTNRQYAQFLATLDDEEAQARRPRYWPGSSYPPGQANHPVVGVNWSDACAFARWADKEFVSAAERARGAAIRLPTEPEWESAAAYPVLSNRAAQGSRIAKGAGDDSSAGRRTYPWGDWPDLTHTTDDSMIRNVPANTYESGIGGTSVLGIFPQGAAACGAEDLAGNVWEWCSTPYQPYPLKNDLQAETIYTTKDWKNRTYVLRGGSWNVDQSNARCAYRDYFDPRYALGRRGFRLARLFS